MNGRRVLVVVMDGIGVCQERLGNAVRRALQTFLRPRRRPRPGDSQRPLLALPPLGTVVCMPEEPS
jgi:hypothetical protein